MPEDVTYHLRIVQRVMNPSDDRRRQYGTHQEPWIEQTALEIVVTPAQFAAIRKAVLEAF